MGIDWGSISHVTKVDPAKPLPEDLGVLEGTDLVMVGGSDDVTEENALATIERIADAHPRMPLLQEPYRGNHVSRDSAALVDGVAVPAVYNGDARSFRGKHVEFFTELVRAPEEVTGGGLPLVGSRLQARGEAAVNELVDQLVPEGYVIQNVESRAATVAGVEEAFTREQVAGAAIATEAFYRFPVFYLEYSGRYGGTDDVAAAAAHLEETTMLYGGGIASAAQTEEILEAGADAVVVGDCFHDDPARFRRTIP